MLKIPYLLPRCASQSWKSLIHVSRDEVSGLRTKRKELPGRQYLAGVCSSHFYMFWYCLPDSSFLLVLNPETSSRDTWIRVLHGWLAQRGNKYGIISKLFETYEKVKFWFFAYFCSTNQFIILIAKSNYKLRSPTPIPSVFNQDFKERLRC